MIGKKEDFMSAGLDRRQIFSKLNEFLTHSWLKRDVTKFNSASAAITDNGIHFSSLIESRTHLLDITSEQAAIAVAVSRKDPVIKEIITIVDGEFLVNPIVIKILADHTRRTGIPIKYTVLNKDGKQLFTAPDTSKLYNIYVPEIVYLEKIRDWSPQQNWIQFDVNQDKIAQLRSAALKGMETHFSSDTKTSYGSAVLANGRFYFGGVYSSFDHRLNLHSEMVASIGAIMDGNKEVEVVGIISNKFVDDLPHMCGCCRQFFSEIQEKNKKLIEVVVFSFDGTQTFRIWLDEYFPSSWSSGLSFDERREPS